ncbi:hypothetical protein [Streptosporangium amethystogenes]|uniref:hypothetical protein n=1 Tax=Streptosporangium amethystogenes TaxID=2002 RepID=UPI0004BD2646|nr:hypothetical protein [Streptosporangium amethystogenes]KUJ65443.1 hypothetical protein ACZ90_48100 [Streptomyces albus subsp. albus]
MDDTKTIAEPTRVVTIGGTEYPVTAPDQATAERVAVVMSLNSPGELKLKSAGILIAACLGEEAWKEILSAYLDGDVDTQALFNILKGIGDALGVPDADA